MSTTSFQMPEFRCFSYRGIQLRYCQSQRAIVSSTMCGVNQNWLREFSPLSNLQQNHQEVKNRFLLMKSDFGFNQMQHSEKDFNGGRNKVKVLCSKEDECNGGINRMEFGQFIVREAILDEEYWAAAWLRAEGRWETRPKERFVLILCQAAALLWYGEIDGISLMDNCKNVKKDEGNTKLTTFESVVGTVDVSIRHLLQGQTFPEGPWRAPMFFIFNTKNPHRYVYVANLCVAKSARRLGIARNMLRFAIETAKSNGVEEVFVHVNRKNKSAQDLYEKMGFQIVENATPHLASEQLYLLLFKA